jgi:hypothetical protein
MRMRTVLVAAAGAIALVVAPASAQAQDAPTEVSVNAKVTPNKAGTKRKPRPVKLKVDVHWETPDGFEKPIVQSADALFPKGSLYNGAKYPKCSQNTLARRGTRACPKGSIMGKGRATAFADDVLTHPQITVVNGGARKVYLYTIMNVPARVQAPVPGTITKMRGKWAYRVHFEVPRVLQIVAGVPIALRDFSVTAGKGDWLATTGCSGGRWPFSVETFYSTGGSTTYEDSIRCR